MSATIIYLHLVPPSDIIKREDQVERHVSNDNKRWWSEGPVQWEPH